MGRSTGWTWRWPERRFWVSTLRSGRIALSGTTSTTGSSGWDWTTTGGGCSGYTLIVSSNTIREFLEVQLTKLPDVFAKVYSAPSDLKTVKKTDSFYSRICEEMGVDPSSLAHVGDSLKFDYEEPRKLGIHSFYLDRQGRSSGEHFVCDLDEFEEKLRFLRQG
jgi:FMN phosphatase YigB (HAD superfamily)